MRSILLPALFVVNLAFAQSGVPLLTPAKSVSPANRAAHAELLKIYVSAEPVDMNPSALDSNVITVSIGGKEYSFVRIVTPESAENRDSWVGSPTGKQDDSYAQFVRGADGVIGTVHAGGETYKLQAGALFKAKTRGDQR